MIGGMVKVGPNKSHQKKCCVIHSSDANPYQPTDNNGGCYMHSVDSCSIFLICIAA